MITAKAAHALQIAAKEKDYEDTLDMLSEKIRKAAENKDDYLTVNKAELGSNIRLMFIEESLRSYGYTVTEEGETIVIEW